MGAGAGRRVKFTFTASSEVPRKDGQPRELFN